MNGKEKEQRQAQRVTDRLTAFRGRLEELKQQAIAPAQKVPRQSSGKGAPAAGNRGGGHLVGFSVLNGKEVRPTVARGNTVTSGAAVKQPAAIKAVARVGKITVPDKTGDYQIPYKRFGMNVNMPGTPKHGSIPLNTTSRYHGVTHSEKEISVKGVQGVQATGQLWLGALNIVAACPVGSRLGLFPIDPRSLGGKLAVLASLWEQHVAKRLRLVYRPVVSAVTPGALAFTYQNDTSQDQLPFGDSLLARASANEMYEEIQVFQPLDIDIRPSDAQRRYFNEESGDSRQQIGGMIIAYTTTAMTADEVGAIGHMYLEYDIDFYAAFLDTDIPLAHTGSLVIGFAAATTVIGNAWSPTLAAALNASGNGSAVMTTDAEPGPCVIIAWCVEELAPAFPLVGNEGVPNGFAPEVGQALFFRVVVDALDAPGPYGWADSTMRLLPYLSLDDALEGQTEIEVDGVGQELGATLLFMEAAVANSASLAFRCRIIPLENEAF